jgi:uncharacterized protein
MSGSHAVRALPEPTPETQVFWDKARERELWLPRCAGCGLVVWYPRAFCPSCSGADLRWFRACGRGLLASYVITHRSAPGFTSPYAIALVELPEGPRLVANLVDIEPDPAQLWVGMPLEVVFEEYADMVLPQFRPAAPSPEAKVR